MWARVEALHQLSRVETAKIPTEILELFGAATVLSNCKSVDVEPGDKNSIRNCC